MGTDESRLSNMKVEYEIFHTIHDLDTSKLLYIIIITMYIFIKSKNISKHNNYILITIYNSSISSCLHNGPRRNFAGKLCWA